MSQDEPQRNGKAFDVVLLGGATDDGEGARVLRARPGRIDAGEVRPMRDGRPLSGGEVVRLERRLDAPALFDVHVECVVPTPEASGGQQTPESSTDSRGDGGPPQVATRAYRDNWEATFGARRRALN
jgi:hypothetical protein